MTILRQSDRDLLLTINNIVNGYGLLVASAGQQGSQRSFRGDNPPLRIVDQGMGRDIATDLTAEGAAIFLGIGEGLLQGPV